MTGIEDLQQRVAAVERQFGLAHEQRMKYSARLLGLMDAVEARLRDQEDEIGRQAETLAQRDAELAERTARAERDEGVSEQLRGMLHSLLQAIEAGGRDVLGETMLALDARVSSLIDATPAESEPETPVAEDAGAAETEPADETPSVESPADEPAAPDAAIADEPVAAIRDDAVAEPESVAHDDTPDPAPDPAPETLDAPAETRAAETRAAEVGPDRGVTLATIMERVGKLVDEDEEPASPRETPPEEIPPEETPAEPTSEIEDAGAAPAKAAETA